MYVEEALKDFFERNINDTSEIVRPQFLIFLNIFIIFLKIGNFC